MVAQRWKKAIRYRARSVGTYIRIDEFVIILANVRIDGLRSSIRVIIVSGGNDKVRVPGLDQVGNIQFSMTGLTVIADDAKADRGR